MSSVTRLIVVRHGNTFNSGDVILRVGSATDIPLTEKGVQQGNAVGRDLAGAGIKIDNIFAAPLMRTMRSAQEIASHYGNIPVEKMEFLTELDYGMDDGQPEDEIVLRLGIVESNGKIGEQTSLDELPQFWNIITGEMSLIGPRPIVEEEVHYYGSNYEFLKSVRPGITGLWQVSGRSDTDYRDRVSLDLYYITNWSVWLDYFIFFKT